METKSTVSSNTNPLNKDSNSRPLKKENIGNESKKSKDDDQKTKTYDDPLLSMFASFRDEIDDNNDRRERLIKTSRDVTSLSKKLIFLLHRFKPSNSDSSNSENPILIESKKKMEEIINLLKEVAKKEGLKPPKNLESLEIESRIDNETESKNAIGGKRKREEIEIDENQKGRFWKYERNIGPGIEEWIEAVTFYHFLSSGNLITHSEIQNLFKEETRTQPQSNEDKYIKDDQIQIDHESISNETNEFSLWIPASRFVLATSDLTGEIMRFATNNAGAQMNGKDVITKSLEFLRLLSNGLSQFCSSIKDMPKKQAVTEQSLRKIEILASTIKIRSSEFKDQDPEIVQEMIKRALNSGNKIDEAD